MWGRKRSFLFLLLLGIFVLTACGNDSSADEGFEKRVAEFKADMKKPSGQKKNDNSGIHIGSVNMGMTSEWFAEVMNGIWDSAKDSGVKVTMLDSDGSLEKEKENILNLVDQGIDALVISPRDSEDSIANLKPVIDAGIPIITWNTSVNMDIESFVCVDSKALGGNTGDYLCEYIKTYGLSDVKLIIIDNRNYDVGIARCDGFKEAIKSMVEQNIISVVAEQDAETFGPAVETVKKLLKEHPEATAIWAWNQPSVLGTIEAVRQSGREDILIMGTDMSMELAKDMLDDEVNLLAITTQMPYNMGYKAVETAVRVVNGETVDKNVVIPLFTYKKSDKELVERYLQVHEKLVDWNGGK